jgi:glycosyltransferase involved in cell wall biosynthesis
VPRFPPKRAWELVFASSLFSALLSVTERRVCSSARVTTTVQIGVYAKVKKVSSVYTLTMTSRFVSVILPTYNRPEMLRQALVSLQSQTVATWEAVVVDDGDGSGVDLVRGLADERIRALMNEGKGQVVARNRAVEQAQGDIIAWLDDDDWWGDTNHLVRVLETLQKPALIHSHGYFVFADTNQRLPYDLPATPESMRKDNTLLTSSVAYPKFFHDELGLLDTTVEGYFDWDWHLRVLNAGYELRTIESKDVCYRLHSGGRSNEAANPQRLKGFQAFKQKHQLDIEIKNHLQVFEEAHVVHPKPS